MRLALESRGVAPVHSLWRTCALLLAFAFGWNDGDAARHALERSRSFHAGEVACELRTVVFGSSVRRHDRRRREPARSRRVRSGMGRSALPADPRRFPAQPDRLEHPDRVVRRRRARSPRRAREWTARAARATARDDARPPDQPAPDRRRGRERPPRSTRSSRRARRARTAGTAATARTATRIRRARTARRPRCLRPSKG